MIPEQDSDNERKQELSSYKYLLGEMGIQMLVAVLRGASTKEAIMMLSGVPITCVIGRLPVLESLNLVNQLSLDEYIITDDGYKFLTIIGQA